MKIKNQFIMFIIGLAFACFVVNQSALGQTESQTLTSSQSEDTQALSTSPSEAQDTGNVTLPVSLIDKEIRDKFDALKTAEQEFLDATRQKLDEKKTETAIGREAPSPSVFPKSTDEVKALLDKVLKILIELLTSLKFLAQLAAVIGAFILAPIIAAFIKGLIPFFRKEPETNAKLFTLRGYVFQTRHLLRAICLVALLAGSAAVLSAMPAFGQTWLIKLAQGLAVVFLLYKAIKQFIPNPLFEKVAIWTLIPLGLMMVFGFYDDFKNLLNGTELMRMGGEPITLMTVLLLVLFGSLFAKIGNMVNAKGQTAIREQDTLEGPTREVVAKIFQILLFIITFVLVLGAAKVPLSGLVVIFSALSLGIGLGLQPIAANFVSGLIILFDRSVKVGDFVVLPDGQEGVVDAINMRSTIVETYDGKDVMVPNTKFTEDVYENWTHKDPRQRFEVYFSVSYDTDIDILEGILIPEVLKHHQVLTDPEMPDLELREFGEYGIKFAIEFWCDGVDDGENKFTSDLNYIVWRTLKKHGISMPLPQREVRMLSDTPKPSAGIKRRSPTKPKTS